MLSLAHQEQPLPNSGSILELANSGISALNVFQGTRSIITIFELGSPQLCLVELVRDSRIITSFSFKDPPGYIARHLLALSNKT